MKPAAFLLVAACASAPLEVHREGESPQKHQTAAADQRGTQDAPLVIKLDSAQRKADSANSQHQGEEVAKAADKLNDYTFALAVVAALQFVAFIYQGWKLRQTVTAMEKQTKIANDEFLATHRPRLIVRTVMCNDELQPDQPMVVKIHFANAGESTGTITRLRVVFRPFWTGQPIPHYVQAELDKANADSARSVPIESGSSGIREATVPENIAQGLFHEDFVTSPNPRKSLYCVGDIEYTDSSGKISRRTGFIRRLNKLNDIFERVKDSDFEYAD